jgi:hypothetical protein
MSEQPSHILSKWAAFADHESHAGAVGIRTGLPANATRPKLRARDAFGRVTRVTSIHSKQPYRPGIKALSRPIMQASQRGYDHDLFSIFRT